MGSKELTLKFGDVCSSRFSQVDDTEKGFAMLVLLGDFVAGGAEEEPTFAAGLGVQVIH